ncbi:TIGR02285 family protein [Pseudomonas sp. RTI1]|nr:TIGR02285 family protein [Pseudomonas sp. RTS4]MEB0086238.1 TIGR02285 family protein [Pseudomonas sp. RTI1]MEB0125026.1 TIGR02285 family protein [Pseudomonas sp. CCC1.2]MEB0153084.1 TIGR02285 family protein [Pseudomonas sp. CCC4.3]MEB0196030.1 TIGR02285 family protein [Pseudomonas sp. 5S4]MEB0210858.1 TIGR02285 family protein [Pseudomonas sp. AB6]
MTCRLLLTRTYAKVALITLMLLCVPRIGMAKDTIMWLLRDFPPLTISSGPQEGQGAIDKLMPLLIAGMPEYDHLMLRVNRARGIQMLNEPSFTCDPTLLWTAERAKTIVFSIPTYAVISNGIVIRRNDFSRVSPFIKEGQVDLAALLASRQIKLGIVAERSYGPVIDQILQAAPNDAVSRHYGNDAVGSLLQMERVGRLRALISYWPEARFTATQEDIDPNDLKFYPIMGTAKYQFAHIGCSDTAQGRDAMEIINRKMRVLRQTKLIDFYADWLDPNSRLAYLEDAKAFFESP